MAGVFLLGIGLFASGLSTAARLLLMAGGATLLFVGLTFVSEWLIEPLAALIGRPFVRVAGATGELARENTSRNPARTAITAGALTVGVAVVAFIAVLGAELRTTINNSFKQQLTRRLRDHHHQRHAAANGGRRHPANDNGDHGDGHPLGTDPGFRQDRADQRHRSRDGRAPLQLQMGRRVGNQGPCDAEPVRRDHQQAVRR